MYASNFSVMSILHICLSFQNHNEAEEGGGLTEKRMGRERIGKGSPALKSIRALLHLHFCNFVLFTASFFYLEALKLKL